MKVVLSIEALARAGVARPAVTWGVFDGVHRGHQELLRLLPPPAAVILFDPHPEEVLYGREVCWLAPLELRLQLLSERGVAACAVQKFSREFSDQGPAEFLRRHIAPLAPSVVVLGHDSAFGRDRTGNLETTRAWGAEAGVHVEACSPVEAGGSIVSSTRIRAALARGDVADAALCLGRPYRLVGPVVSGRRRGRSIGFPTCNLSLTGQTVPAPGVYGGRARVLGETSLCVINIGLRPTFDDGLTAPVVEAHLLDRPGLEAYGERLELDVERRLRDEMKFSGAGALHDQIRRDIEAFRAAVRS